LSIVWHWKARERRPSWLALLVARAFAVRTHPQEDDAEESDANTSPDESTRLPPPFSDPAGPRGGQDDDAAFDAFFAQYERPLYGYLRRMLPTHDAALDVAQETFFRAWQRFETIRGYDRPQAWLFRVATNLALDVIRRRQPTALSRLLSGHGETTADENPSDDAMPALIDPSDMERSLAERDLVNRVLRRLPDRQRAVVLLWAAHGLTTTEIAEVFETTDVNVRQMLSRGRARFRELYELAQRSG
jgi:RNA polymerase sigma-70 factor (ECF subfamily)